MRLLQASAGVRPHPWQASAVPVAVIGIAMTVACATSRPRAADAAPPRTGRLQLRSDRIERAELVSLSPRSSRWRSAGTTFEVTAEGLLAWGRCPAAALGPSLLLHDGSMLAGRLRAWSAEEVVVESLLFGEIRLPTDAVRGWQSGSPPAAPQPSAALSMRIELTNGDILPASSFTLADGSRLAIVQRATDGPTAGATASLAIPTDRIQSLCVPPASADRLGQWHHLSSAIVGLQDGSRLMVASVQAAPGPLGDEEPAEGQLRLQPVAGLARPDRWLTCPRDAVLGLLATGDGVLPLAWLPPRDFEQTPQLGSAWPLTTATTLTGQPLAARGRPVFTGLGMHAAARVAYQLPDGLAAQQLLTAVAVDDSAGQGGSVRLRIRAGTGPEAARLVFESGILRGGEPPLEIAVPLDQAHWLELTVSPTDDGDVLDRTLWLEPRLLTRQTSQTGPHVPSPAASGALQETFPGRR